MKLVSLFSGIGAFEKGLTDLGIDVEVAGFSEIDKWAIQSYCAIHNVSEDLNLGDISKIKNEELPKDVDMITYGFPCQDISIAGQGKGINEDTRSGLLYEAERVIEHVKPKYAIAENVKNLIGKRFKGDFDKLLERLDSYGYNNYWQVLNAKDYGIPQNRERVFIISIRKDIDRGNFEFPVYFDSELRLKDFLLDEVEDKYYINNDRTDSLLGKLILDKKVVGNLNPSGKGMNGNVYNSKKTSPTLTTNKGEGIKCIVASRGRSINNVSDKTEQKLEPNTQGVTNTITTVQKDNLLLEPKRLGGLFDKDGKKRQAGAVWDKDYISPTIDTCQGGYREPSVIVKQGTKKGYDVATVGDSINISFPTSKTRRGRVGKGVSQTLDTTCNLATLENDYRIRKLTPLECWRLMGFKDIDYWKARTRLENKFYNGGDRSNSQMYKQAGNSIVVNVLVEIFKELFKFETI